MEDLDFKKKIEERMKELPEPLARAIKESNWEKAVFDIGRKNSLHIDDIGTIQNELILVLTGIVHPDEFKRVLVDEVGLTSEKTEQVISDINEIVNQKIKDSLKKDFEDEENSLSLSEQKTIKKAGVSFGEEEEENSSFAKEEQKPEESFVPIPNLENEPIKNNEPESAQNIFKTKTTVSSPEVQNVKKIDPYREPVE